MAPVEDIHHEALERHARHVRPFLSAAVVAGGYAATALIWIFVSDRLLTPVFDLVAHVSVWNALAFVAFTTTVLFGVVYRYLWQLRESEKRFVEAQAALRAKDLAVRQGYVDVLDAVTGGKLILITEDELWAALGELVAGPGRLVEARSVSAARREINEAIAGFTLNDRDAVILAVGEALTNAVKHGGGDEWAIYRQGDCLQFFIKDNGPGIDFRQLPKATLIQGFSTSNTMGLGFTIMLDVCDRVLLTTDMRGTCVVLEVSLVTAHAQYERPLQAILFSGG